MTPARLWHVAWIEHRPGNVDPTEQTRNFKTPGAAARQVASVVACPDEVAELRGVWCSGELKWQPLDAEELIAEHADQGSGSDLDEGDVSLDEWRRRIAEAWRQ